MGYVAVRGGGKAIEESLKLLEYQRVSASSAWGTDEIEGTFPELVDQVMGCLLYTSPSPRDRG